jgi:hypothetical protein
MSTPSSTSSSSTDESIDITPEFNNPQQVEEQYEKLIEKYNDILLQLEALEATDDDIQELREKTLDEYEFQMLAEAYDACGQRVMADGLRCQAEEAREKIQELQSALDDIEIKDHFFELYKMEIQKETLEIQLKACEKYLEKSKKKNVVAANCDIFNSVNTIHVTPIKFYSNSETSYAVQIFILVNGEEKLDVIDVIKFNSNGLINSIVAFKLEG